MTKTELEKKLDKEFPEVPKRGNECWLCSEPLPPGKFYVDITVNVDTEVEGARYSQIQNRCCIRCAVEHSYIDGPATVDNVFGGEIV